MSTTPQASELLNLALTQGRVQWEEVQSILEDAHLQNLEASNSEEVLHHLVDRNLIKEKDLEELAAQLNASGPLDLPTIPREAQGEDPLWAKLEEAFPGWEHYEVLEFIAEGGMGRVYMAHDRHLDRLVALKFLSYFASGSEARFAREARTQAQINHENICRIYEVGEFEGLPYIAMQYIEDVRLDEIAPQLRLVQKVDLIRQVAEGLHAAHRIKLIHRDIKPANILVEALDQDRFHPVIVDFGLAKEEGKSGLTRADQSMGTLGYAAPEQLFGSPEQVDHRSDIYSLGVTLYVILTGHLPVDLAATDGLMGDARPLRTHLPEAPKDLETVVMKCLERGPARRYESAWALAEDLGRFLAGEPVLAQKPSFWSVAWRRARQHPVVAGLAAAGTLGILLGGGFALRSHFRTQRVMALAQDFGRESTRIELELRLDRLLPLHDQREVLRQAREDLRHIEQAMERIGSVARGPGHAALGQGYLALREYDQARRHLEAALEAGYDTPELRNQLGITLALILQRELLVARWMERGTALRLRQEKLETEYSVLALSHFRNGSGGRNRGLAEAWIRFLEKDDFQALSITQNHWKHRPGDYESLILGSIICFQQANQHHIKTQTKEALDKVKWALKFLDQARSIARSDPELEQMEAELYNYLSNIRKTNTPYELPLDEETGGTQAIERLMIMDPQSPEGALLKASLIRRRTEVLTMNSKDPRKLCKEGIALLEKVAHIESTDPRYSKLLGSLLLHQAQGYRDDDLTAEPILERSADVFRRAIPHFPGHSTFFAGLANAHYVLAVRRRDRGFPAAKDLESALQADREHCKIYPQWSHPMTNCVLTLSLAAQWAWEDGKDPVSLEKEALQLMDRAQQLNPGTALVVQAWIEILAASITRAVEEGENPQPFIEQLRTLADSIRDQPRLESFRHRALAEAEFGLARQAILKGDNGVEMIQKAYQSIQACSELQPDERDTHIVMAHILLAQIEALVAQHQNPKRALQALESLLSNPRSAGFFPRALRIQMGFWSKLHQAHDQMRTRGQMNSDVSEDLLQLIQSNPSPWILARARIETALWTLATHRPIPSDTHQKAKTLIEKARKTWPRSIRLQQAERLLQRLLPAGVRNFNGRWRLVS